MQRSLTSSPSISVKSSPAPIHIHWGTRPVVANVAAAQQKWKQVQKQHLQLQSTSRRSSSPAMNSRLLVGTLSPVHKQVEKLNEIHQDRFQAQQDVLVQSSLACAQRAMMRVEQQTKQWLRQSRPCKMANSFASKMAVLLDENPLASPFTEHAWPTAALKREQTLTVGNRSWTVSRDRSPLQLDLWHGRQFVLWQSVLSESIQQQLNLVNPVSVEKQEQKQGRKMKKWSLKLTDKPMEKFVETAENVTEELTENVPDNAENVTESAQLSNLPERKLPMKESFKSAPWQHRLSMDEMRLNQIKVRPLKQVKNETQKETESDEIFLSQLLAMGAHWGRHCRDLNPAMVPHLAGVRGNHCLIDLNSTMSNLRRASQVTSAIAQRGGIILFVAKQDKFSHLVQECATHSHQFYLSGEWRAGLITNRQVVLSSKTIVPDLVILLDSAHLSSAVRECHLALIPTVALCDTNQNPLHVTFAIPGNNESDALVNCVAWTLAKSAKQGFELMDPILQRAVTAKPE